MLTTTLNQIKNSIPVGTRTEETIPEPFDSLLIRLNKKQTDDEPVPFTFIFEILGLRWALYCCGLEPRYKENWKKLALRFAGLVENVHPSFKQVLVVAEKYMKREVGQREVNRAKAKAVVDVLYNQINAETAIMHAVEYILSDTITYSRISLESIALLVARSSVESGVNDVNDEIWTKKCKELEEQFLKIVKDEK